MVLLPLVVPGEDSVRRIPTLFGMIGLVCAVALLPLFPLLHYSGVEYFELPPSQSATLALLLNAATSTVLPDMLLARAVMMTSPLVATLGLSLMIPLSVVADYVRQQPCPPLPFTLVALAARCLVRTFLADARACLCRGDCRCEGSPR